MRRGIFRRLGRLIGYAVVILFILFVVSKSSGLMKKLGVKEETAETISNVAEYAFDTGTEKAKSVAKPYVEKLKDFVDKAVDSAKEKSELVVDTSKSGTITVSDTKVIRNTAVPAYNRMEVPERVGNHQVVQHFGYALSWNEKMRAADWVAYELSTRELDNTVTSRTEDFRSDPLVDNCPELDEFKGIGNMRPHPGDKGHLAPAADFKWNANAMSDTFYLSNCVIQWHSFNSGIWLRAEDAVRDSARITGKVYVVTGPVLTDDEYEHFKSLIIPNSCYKALLIVDGDNVQSIAMIIPQTAGKKDKLSQYLCSVNELEKIINIDLFPMLDDSIEEKVESSYDISFWPKSFR